jgi:hypothetical protein
VGVVNEVLVVQGTPGPDRIGILPTKDPSYVGVVFDGRMLGGFGPVTSLDIDASGGSDTVSVDPRITLPSSLDGSGGNDRIRGGSGVNVLIGGDGRNILVGRQGRDTFLVSAGLDRVVNQRSLGVVQVGPSASGAGLRGLSGSYTLSPLRVAGPAVVGVADLRNGRIVDQLKRDYDGGQPVALTNATPESVAALASVLGYPAPPVFPADAGRAEVVTFRKTDQGGRTLFSTSVLEPVVNVPTTPAQRLAGRRANALADRAFLEGAFTADPAMPAPVGGASTESNLIDLANAYQSSVLVKNDHGDNIQIVNTAYAARSFLNQEDLYYVSQEVSDHIADTALGQAGSPPFPPFGYASWGNKVSNTLTGLKPSTVSLTIQPSPQTSLSATTETSGVSFTIGGSAGFNQAQGLNVGLNASVTISHSTTKTVPPMNITYQGDPATAVTAWNYEVPHEHLPQPSQTMNFATGWIWAVPFSAYAPNQTALTFTTSAGLGYLNPFDVEGFPPKINAVLRSVSMDTPLTSTIPFPFGTNFQLGKPQVTAVSPGTVKPGDTFTIEGQAFYPSTVQSVLIGGQPLSAANFKPVSDTKIQVVAPNTPGLSQRVVVQTSQGTSNSDITVNIAGATQLNVQAQPISAEAGQSFTDRPVATFTDSDPNAKPGDFHVTIDWGDGKTSDGTITAAGPGAFNVTGSHTYATAGTYTFEVGVTDSVGDKAGAKGTATVTAANTGGPRNLEAQPVSADAGRAFTNVTLATFADTDPGVNASDFTASVDWGDGITTASTTVVLTGPGTFDVLGTHTYNAAGTYTFGIQVTDNKGRKVTTRGSAKVSGG